MTIQDLRDKGLIIFEAISGSIAYGTNIPTSDTDIRGVFILPEDDILGMNYVEQVNDTTNDVIFYELRRFIQLLSTNNPNILELLNTPDGCVVYKHPVFDMILEQRDKFITKICRDSFGGYAIQQIKKASGKNKKINNPQPVDAKKPIDFCYVINGGDSVLLRDWISKYKYETKFCGVSNIPHARDLYALFYDDRADLIHSGGLLASLAKKFYKSIGSSMGFGYKGLEIENSNDIRLSLIPKGEQAITVFSYNKDGYRSHLDDYNSYWEWVNKRNEHRYQDVVTHGKGYDGKNLMHCHRLLDMSLEIMKGEGINVRRANKDHLLKIRKGEFNYDEIVKLAEDKIKELDYLFELAELPMSVDRKFTNDLLVEMRKLFYMKS